MPFWSSGYLYIPASIFAGSVWRALGVSSNYNESSQVLILYSSSDHTLVLTCYLKQNYIQDRSGNISYPGALTRNGTIFVPASLVAKYFNLEYSVTKVSRGYLVWLRKPGYGLSDKEFADAAVWAMAERYSAYEKAKEPVAAVDTPSDEPVTTVTSEGTEIQGKAIYLCLEAGTDTASILDALDRYQAQAAFFCTLSFLEEQGDLLRRMIATGQSIGILVDADDGDVEEQLEAGNRALEQATCGRTRLVMVQNGSDADRQAASAAGYRCLQPDLDRSGFDLRSASNATSLLKRVSTRKGNVTVWLADTVDATGLRALLAATESGDGQCLAWTETA
jgi:hypothetical protein